MTQFHRWIASGFSGFLLVACFPKLSLHPLVWIALLPLLLVLAGESSLWRAFGWAYLSGAIYFAGSCYWFVEVTRQYGGLSLGLALTALAAFVVVFSIFFGAFGLVVGTLARKSPARALLASPFLWVAMELARTYLITGFPWNLLGYGVASAGMRQVASVTGVYGLSFLAAATSALAAWSLRHGREKRPWLALGGWFVLLLVGNWAFAPPAPTQGPDLAVLVQPNVPLDEQADSAWAPWVNPTKLNQLVDMSLQALASEEREEGVRLDEQGRPGLGVPPLIIWAENPAPFYFTRDPVFHFKGGTTVGAIVEHMDRYVPADLAFQNERTRWGTWAFVSQEITAVDSVHFGWAHAFRTPGDPCQHNDCTIPTPDGLTAYAPNDNQADMLTAAYKHKLSKDLLWYTHLAATINGPSAHYDLGAGGRGVTTDCRDAFSGSGGAFSTPHCFTGTTLFGASTGLQYKF